jgi:hypothetical protein
MFFLSSVWDVLTDLKQLHVHIRGDISDLRPMNEVSLSRSYSAIT